MADGAGATGNKVNVQDVPEGYVPVDIIARDRDGAKLLAELLQAGLIKNGASFGAIASGYVASDKLDTISRMENVTSASVSHSSTGTDGQTTVHPGIIDPPVSGEVGIGQTKVHPGLVDPIAVSHDVGTGQTQVHPGIVDPVAVTGVGTGQTEVHPGLVDPSGFTHAVGDGQTKVHPGVVNPTAAGAAPVTSTSVHDPIASTTVAAPVDGDKIEAVDVVAKDGDGAALLKSLQSSGMMTGGASWGSMASGYIKASDFAKLGQDSSIVSATVSQSNTFAGKVDNEADPALHADTARTNFGVDGTGVKVGILSDSFNTSGNADTTTTDIASGDLPQDTQVLNDSPNGTDEGRGMAQIVHDIAPGAGIRFDTANGGQAVFAQHIVDLANAGCKVIVDDVGYFAELSYQDGPIAQAINQVKAMGVTYLSSAGNNGTNGYESAFHAGAAFSYSGTNYTHDNFGGSPTLAFTAGAQQTITMEWAQPGASAGNGSPGATSDLDLFITDAQGHVLNPNGQGRISNIGGDPVEVVQPNLVQGQTYYMQVGLKSGSVAPSDVRIILQDDGSGAVLANPADNTNTGTFYGHAGATGGIGVAAAPYNGTPQFGTTPPRAESFTSPGPDNVYFSTAGAAIAHEARDVDLTGVDGGETTFFGFGAGPHGYPQFYGTSAAAPSVAGVAALMLQKNPNLTPDQIKTILQTTADHTTLNSAGNLSTNTTGSGLVNATQAVALAAACFTDGTRIRLSGGVDVAVEDLVVGDLVETATGGVRPVIWIGHRTLRPGEHSMPSGVLPVRVSAGAFGHGLPERDLMLSPGHPVLVGADADNAGGHLVPIMCLINGTTIRRIEVETVTYWHIELDAHDVLLAEGLPAESYLDWGDRAFFIEGTDHALVNPDFVIPGLSGRCRPVALDGAVVEAERRRLDSVFAVRLTAACDWPSCEENVAQAHWH